MCGCAEAEARGDEEADEQFVVLGADAVGEDGEAEGEGGDDDQDFGVGGELARGGGGAGGEGGLDDGPLGACLVAELSQPVSSGSPGSVSGRSNGRERAPSRAARVATPAIQPPGSRLTTPPSWALIAMIGVPGGGEGAERGELEGAVGAGGGEPAQALDAVGGRGRGGR